MMGMTLNKRLRGLRDSHAGFAKAVQELDGAAARTQASLADLRASTAQAQTELAARIDQARLLTQRLDKLTADAAQALEQPLSLTRPLSAPSAALRPVALAQRQPAANPRSKVLIDDDLFEVAGGLDRRAPIAAMGGRR
jgi:uncharacterized coiled-coil protein SlyX